MRILEGDMSVFHLRWYAVQSSGNSRQGAGVIHVNHTCPCVELSISRQPRLTCSQYSIFDKFICYLLNVSILYINQFLQNDFFCNRSMLIGSSYPCHLVFLLIRQWIFFFQLLQDNFFPFSGCLVHFQQVLTNAVLQEHHLVQRISMILQIVSA